MVRARSLLWLVALVAFAMSSFGSVSIGHAAASAEQTAMADCPDHAPPPDCPSQDTGKHAAGQCCPLMAGVVALLPPAATAAAAVPYHARPATIARDLTGLTSTQDPPPPRV
ncbi:MAG: hypothetical protein HYX38_03160 [Rhodospirillales bacterium]|nr:hypothetical protein [Rhodospirillales bacterium]